MGPGRLPGMAVRLEYLITMEFVRDPHLPDSSAMTQSPETFDVAQPMSSFRFLGTVHDRRAFSSRSSYQMNWPTWMETVEEARSHDGVIDQGSISSRSSTLHLHGKQPISGAHLLGSYTE